MPRGKVVLLGPKEAGKTAFFNKCTVCINELFLSLFIYFTLIKRANYEFNPNVRQETMLSDTVCY